MALHPDRFNVLSLFAGIGGMDKAIRLALPQARTVAMVEGEAAAAAILVEGMQNGSLDQAPIWDRLETFDGQPWRGLVDCVSASPPCQPFSCAGKQGGLSDARALGNDGRGPLYHFCRIVGECLPAVVFVENVPLFVSGGHFRGVGEELCRMGYTVESPLFIRAADVGAPHKRERVFILAHRGDFGVCLADAEPAEWRRSMPGRGAERRTALGRSGEELADPARHGDDRRDRQAGDGRRVRGASDALADSMPSGQRTGRQSECESRNTEPASRLPMGDTDDASCVVGECNQPTGTQHATAEPSRSAVGHAALDGRREGRAEHGVRSGRHATTDASRSLPLFPPGLGTWRHVADPDHPGRFFAVPLDRDAAQWCAVLEHRPDLAPAVGGEVHALADGPGCIDQLRGLGNSVVIQQAALALLVLLHRVKENG